MKKQVIYLSKPLHRGFKKIDPEKLKAYVDETGINSYLYREYGYAPRGQKVYDKVSEKEFQRTNIIAVKLSKEIIASMHYNGTTNSTLFKLWFEKCLLPCLKKGTAIVMDNDSFHRKK